MNLILRATRPLTFSVHLLCALFLLILAAPMCSAAGTGPVITNATITPATIIVTGGAITVSATVTTTNGPISSVTATVALNGAGYYRSDNSYNNTVTLYNSGGNVYTGTIPSAGTNTSTAAYAYTATVTATDQIGSSTVFVAGQAVQVNDNIGPTITFASIGPSVLPAVGGPITVTATVTDPNGRTLNSVTAMVALNGAGYLRSDNSYNNTITLYNSGGNVFTGTIPSFGNNTSTVFYKYTASITAMDDLKLSNSLAASGQTTQENTSGTTPPLTAGLTHILWTNTDGRLSLWNYDPLSGGFTQITYGPYPGWSAKAVADGPDGKTRVLWDNTNGTMSLWSLDNTTGIFTQNSFGPYPGWTATAISVAP